MQIQRIITIDDDPLYLAMLGEFSKLFNISYISASDVSQIQCDELLPTDLILVDIYMPDDDGLDVLMKLEKAKFKGYVAVMSGAPKDIINSVLGVVESLNINLIGKLSKPIKISEFKSLLTTAPKVKQDNGMTAGDADTFTKIFNKKSLQDWFKLGYIYPVFQPQVNIQTDVIEGLESLTRINHPRLDNMPPSQFIRMIESSGVINEFTLLFIQNALKLLTSLVDSNQDLSCSFNISATSLDAKFVEQLIATVNESKVPASAITIELTESSALTMSKDALYAISKLKISGFSLSIDDFGTGYSSIKQLVELPFDELKVDRSFVMDLESNKASLAIVNATIDLANSLNLNLVVEGVETEFQKKCLIGKGELCIQGYYYSKPLKIEQLVEYLANRQVA